MRWLLWFALFCLTPAGALKVVVSFQPLHELTKQVAGPEVQVEQAIPAGASPHTFEPSPRDLARFRQAQLLVLAGFGSDGALERLWAKSASRTERLKLGEHLKFTPIRNGQTTDPHWWLDAQLMAQAAPVLGEALAKLDPAGAPRYRQNAQRAAQALNQLHQELQSTLKPIKGAKLVTLHNAFAYFARAYQLRLVSLPGDGHDTEVSPQQLAQLVQLTRREQLRAIFSEPQASPAVAQILARETGLRLFSLDAEGSSGALSYAEMMRRNRDTLLEALRPAGGQR